MAQVHGAMPCQQNGCWPVACAAAAEDGFWGVVKTMAGSCGWKRGQGSVASQEDSAQKDVEGVA